MNWKVKLVLAYAKVRKPIDVNSVHDIPSLRKKSETAARIGSLLFDRKISLQEVTDTHAGHIPLRIYKNSSANGQRVMIYYHGGGFVLYGLDSHDLVCRRLCAMNNCIVVSVDYRVAPEHTFPVAHQDAFTALQWVRDNIENYGGNKNDLVVAGDSAGGNLAACMAHVCRQQSIPLKAQVLVYPWIDGRLNNPSIDRNGKGYMLEKPTMLCFQQQYTPRVEDHCVPEVSPCFETEFTGLCPAFILTAEYDPLLDDGLNYHRQLASYHVKSTYKEYAGLFHGFFNLPYVHPNAMQAYYDITDFLKAV